METVDTADVEKITAAASQSLLLMYSLENEIKPLVVVLGTSGCRLRGRTLYTEKGTLAGRRSNNVGGVYSNSKVRSSRGLWWTDEDTNHALADNRRYDCVCVWLLGWVGVNHMYTLR